MKRRADRDRDRANTLANARANAHALANIIASGFNNAEFLDHANVLADTLDHDHDLARAHDVARDLTLTLACACTRDLDLARAHACGLSRGLARTHDRSRDLAQALVRDLVNLDTASHGARAVRVSGARSMPGRVSRGLVAVAVRLLPVAHRRRYRAEFRVELVELPRRERWGYALRVLARAWELRRALVEVVCTPDGATARRAER